MEFVIDIIDNTGKLTDEQLQEVEDILKFAAKYEKITDDVEVSVTFTTNAEIQQLNNDYRNKNAPTDVLSFPMEDDEDEFQFDFEGFDEPRMLGDIIISVQIAEEQAVEYGHTVKRELSFLAVHGFLHLLGYDHETAEEEKEMFDKQKDILKQYGIGR